MRRMDRLIAIVIALQQRQESAQVLADKLEVSKRTIMRDMQALSEMGIPLYAEIGPTGGYRLSEGYSLPPLQLDVQETLTVLVALRALTAYADTPFNRERWTVIDKLRHVLPPATLHQVEPLLELMRVEVPKRSFKAPLLNELLAYCSEGAWMNAHYRSEKHRRWLLLKPKRVYAEHGFWYCEAYSPIHGEIRTFRADRFDELQDADPAAAQDQVGLIYPPKKETADNYIRIRAELSYRGMLMVEQDPHIGERVHALQDDLWEVDFLCPASEWEWAKRFFFSLGSDAHVREPDLLRADLYERARDLCNRYRAEAEKELVEDSLLDAKRNSHV
ncbi:WYL domain-containing protein [Paenibacillus sp. ACRRX]|uniref:helix-turn-helix transcriptional regulator n=1 Tax=Paenibacillus sp. ACRRX TaxID=2918206 RepID=UPI001EF4D6D6|nr:WYL domain-containing protein [Paenibacillus sp. ACRRX]MCG7409320.1 WYL domain-containing protein [Paenibacillus sp. ACRRX]